MMNKFKSIMLSVATVATLGVASQATANQYFNCAARGDTGECVPAQSVHDFGNTYTKTEYPLVLVHGFTGWTNPLGVDYYYGVAVDLMRTGTDTLFAPLVSGQNATEVRGEQLLQQIETMQALSGKEKFNFVGHSHGSPTVRYVHAAKPEAFASITSVAGVVGGSKVAVDVLAARENKAAGIPLDIALKIFEFISGVLGFVSEGSEIPPQDVFTALEALTPETMAAFNAKYPVGVPTTECGEGVYEDENGVQFYSFAGNRVITNVLDPLEWFFGLTSLSFKPTETVNDTLMEPCKTHFGKVLRDDYPLNHMDLVNSVMGFRDITVVSPISIYRAQANRLKNEGN